MFILRGSDLRACVWSLRRDLEKWGLAPGKRSVYFTVAGTQFKGKYWVCPNGYGGLIT